MTGDEPGRLLLSRCTHCQSLFVPRVGPCPHCGGVGVAPAAVPARGIVRAATSLESPAAGWKAPHRLAIVELAEGVLLLAVAENELPVVGKHVALRRDGETFRTSPEV
ncbi:MAG: zinc ribbon domain-containing protein [Thermoplasmata archaeon]|nr:zinc ribbon domain-containing protein [Thermoplasmata archaeon]